MFIQLELDRLPGANQARMAAIETDDIGLKAVAQPGLGDSDASLQVSQQHVELVPGVVVELVDVGSDDPGEQQDPESGRGLGWQPQVTEGNPPGRCHGARVPNLKLGEQHEATVDAIQSRHESTSAAVAT